MKGKVSMTCRIGRSAAVMAVLAIAAAKTTESINSAIAEWCKVMDYKEGRV